MKENKLIKTSFDVVKPSDIIIQPNPITKAAYPSTEQGKKIMYLILKRLKNYLNENNNFTQDPKLKYANASLPLKNLPPRIFKFKKSELKDVGKNISHIQEAAKDLRKSSFKWRTDDDRLIETGFIQASVYDTTTHEFEFVLSDKMAEYIHSHLTKGHTFIDLQTAFNLKGVYSKRFYELCCMNKRLITFNLSIDFIVETFDLKDKYSRYTSIKARIIEPAYKAIYSAFNSGNSEIYFTYEEIKKPGKTRPVVDSIEITIHSSNPLEIDDSRRSEMVQLIPRILTNSKDKNYSHRIYNYIAQNPTMHPKMYIKINSIVKRAKKENKNLSEYGPLLRHILKEDFNIV